VSRGAISADLRRRVADTARHRCGYCLTSQRVVGPLLEIDHIVPEAHGGTSEEENLFLACPMCNGHKSDKRSATDPRDVKVAVDGKLKKRWDETLGVIRKAKGQGAEAFDELWGLRVLLALGLRVLPLPSGTVGFFGAVLYMSARGRKRPYVASGSHGGGGGGR